MAEINNEIIVIQININSIQSIIKRTEFDRSLKTTKPQIVLISETKINNSHKVSFNGYKMFRSDREKDAGGGTAICVDENIVCEYIQTPTSIKTIECCLMKLKLQNNQNIIVASIYKPPSKKINGKQTAIKINPRELNTILNIDKNAKYIIGGDFNSHHSEWNSDRQCSNGRAIDDWYQTNKDSYNISIYASKNPTCMRTALGSHIDFGFISNQIEITNAPNNKNLPSTLYSDHAAIVMKIKIAPATKLYTSIKNYKNTKWTQLNRYVESKINEINIHKFSNMSCDDIDALTSKINEIYTSAIDKYVPNVKICSDSMKLSNRSLKLIKEKKTLLRKNTGTKIVTHIKRSALT